ncbi:hypothetical protein CAOG_06476 [Capsaspora owczarzaki ATCC 30864]|uniref:Ketoreductase domain-containing protein n=1 Tax=Capsaspora owczarzaki (strain ATCC 30864) TaxID=595528 RepID=A0A0D2VX05_CAPO3|nr:hypothetical protein CAOG_06476 [Capsaspora owczarzaki ATCC 30864]KJE96107.1 hypothetical protein CAOG_006476 [Capsaspora owczarzaki ATCC 30864]|eukprot:XP_004345225.1 hypothetical protein CAOG_06476 [Capsaspora owczarzaki ATCC 30864]
MELMQTVLEWLRLPRSVADGSIEWCSSAAIPGILLWSLGAWHVLRFLKRSIIGPRGIRVRSSLFLITGASSGIGEALARDLVARGARVILVARNATLLGKVASEMNAQHGAGQVVAHTIAADCSNPADVDRLVNTCITTIGVPEAIVNCAGAGRWRYLHEMSAEEVKGCMDAPYFAAALVTRGFLPVFLERNAGTFVNIQSPAGYAPWSGSTGYACTRFALRGLCEALRADLHNTGINVQEVILAETASNYFSTNDNSLERIPKIAALFGVLTVTDAAGYVVRAILSGEPVTCYNWRLAAAMYVHSWAPGLINASIRLTGWSIHKAPKVAVPPIANKKTN